MSFETVARQSLYRQMKADGGSVRALADRGTHRQLLARGGRYTELYEIRFREDRAVA